MKIKFYGLAPMETASFLSAFLQIKRYSEQRDKWSVENDCFCFKKKKKNTIRRGK